MTEERTPREIALKMEPVIRYLRDGVDALDSIGRSDRYDKDAPNGLLYVADSLGDHVAQLKELWRELCTMTGIDCAKPPLKV